MALVLNQEQEMLRDSVLVFLKENAPVKQLRQLRDQRDASGFSADLWRQFANMGFTGVLIPEEYGGLGLGNVEAGIIMEAIGRHLTSIPFFSTALLMASALVRHGTQKQKQHYLPQIAAGMLVAALAVDESSKHRPQQQRLRATVADNGFTLTGEKTFVVDGHVADTLMVVARTSGADDSQDGITLFLVERTTPGVAVEHTVMADSHNAARMTFNDVRVGADAVLGGVGQGWMILEGILDTGRAALAAELLGIADEVFERTLGYLKERKQFDKIIGEFQALQHRVSNLYSEIEITRAAVLRSQQQLDEAPGQAAAIVSVAKARAGKTATVAVQEAVQMHGGMGMTDEFEMGFFMKRARVAQELLGDANFHADRWARLGGY